MATDLSKRTNSPQQLFAAGTADKGTMDLDQLRSKARKQVEEAIKLIPLERKAAYVEALEKDPYLVQTESDPLKFLRRCDYNIWDASERLCLYWKERKDIFGPERAFLPLVLTGDGALDKSDILSLQAGFPAMLPRSKGGLQAIYCDRRQFLPDITAADKHRGLFYLFRVLAEDERAQTEGILAFILLVTPRLQDVDLDYALRALSIAIHAMPVKVKFHFLNVLPKGAHRKLYAIQELITSTVGHCFTLGASEADVAVHIEREEGEICLLLQEEFGLTEAGIPTALGGTWAFVESSSWCRNQAVAERKQYKWLQKKRAPLSAREETVTAAATTTTKSLLSRTKKRAASVIHSRRKRERRRHEWALLTSEQDELRQEQTALMKENVRLEDLWRQAQTVVGGDRRGLGISGLLLLEQQSTALAHRHVAKEEADDKKDGPPSPSKKMKTNDETFASPPPTEALEMLQTDHDDDHVSQRSGENPKQRKRQQEEEEACCDNQQPHCKVHPRKAKVTAKDVTAPSFGPERTFSQIAAEAVCCSPEDQDALIQVLLAQRGRNNNKNHQE